MIPANINQQKSAQSKKQAYLLVLSPPQKKKLRFLPLRLTRARSFSSQPYCANHRAMTNWSHKSSVPGTLKAPKNGQWIPATEKDLGHKFEKYRYWKCTFADAKKKSEYEHVTINSEHIYMYTTCSLSKKRTVPCLWVSFIFSNISASAGSSRSVLCKSWQASLDFGKCLIPSRFGSTTNKLSRRCVFKLI